MWLSCSSFYYQYYRVYSPVTFGQNTDKNGDYIRKYVPALKNYPPSLIYCPWEASLSEQKKYGCVIGKDYPAPIVDHKEAKEECMRRMKLAYEVKIQKK
jgi:cryptochrome